MMTIGTSGEDQHKKGFLDSRLSEQTTIDFAEVGIVGEAFGGEETGKRGFAVHHSGFDVASTIERIDSEEQRTSLVAICRKAYHE